MARIVTCLCCAPKELSPEQAVAAARRAIEINPANAPQLLGALEIGKGPAMAPTPDRLAVVTRKYWKAKGKRFTVKFLDTSQAALKQKILLHMNAWSQYANVSFAETSDAGAEVRIARAEDGYWSYLGTDILGIPRGQPTMNLEGFTLSTPDAEYRRVVRHETGHTLGCPHEHMRKQLVDKLDREKVIAYYETRYGWSRQRTINQVLTPLDDASIMGTANADRTSIMAYQIPGELTKDGLAIPGGVDIDATDAAFIASVYPRPGVAAPSAGGGGEAGSGGGGGTAPVVDVSVRDNAPPEDVTALRAEIVRLKDQIAALKETIRILSADG